MIFVEGKGDNVSSIFFGNINLNNNINSYITVPSNKKITKQTSINEIKSMSGEQSYEINELTQDMDFLLEEL